MKAHGKKGPVMIVKMISMAIIAILVFGLVVMYLWNWLVPDLFNGPEVTFFQALGLLLLAKIFSSGFGKGHHMGHGHGKEDWKKRFEDKWRKYCDEAHEEVEVEEETKQEKEKTNDEDSPKTVIE